MGRNPRALSSATSSHDNGFNLVRLVAATLVVVYHAWQLNGRTPGAQDPLTAWLSPVADLGMVAVGVFFLVSGLFVSHSWLRDPHLLRFAVRRVTRIVPGLLVCLLLTTTVAVTFFSPQGIAGLFSADAWHYIFSNATLHSLRYLDPPAVLAIPGVLEGRALNGSLWTLYWEARMYVVLALLGLAAVAPMRVWLLVSSLALIAAAQAFPALLSGYIWETAFWTLFLGGIVLQTLARHLRFGVGMVLATGILLALNWTRNAALTPSGFSLVGVMLFACAVALWVGSARLPSWLSHIQKHDYSYGVYIYHWPVMLMLAHVMPEAGALRLLAAGLVVTFACAAFSWHCVEHPAMKLARRMPKRQPAPLRAAA
ncbi:acyltransferase family protein [Pseudoduganella sp. OTU4001]|uniref:acyltransferase family protein n=1 Tax=Pseudoduganella sp. OTU4001 TaxID=3043854 RepID=UPI00313BAB5F